MVPQTRDLTETEIVDSLVVSLDMCFLPNINIFRS